MNSAAGDENLPEPVTTPAPSKCGKGNGSAPRGRLTFPDALRAFGALGIAAYHIHRYRPLREPVDQFLPNVVHGVCMYGWIGVQMFWVLSGFMMAYSLRNTELRLATAGNFMLRRIVRLGVPYWTIVLSVASLDFALRRMIAEPDLTDAPITWARLAANLLFLQDILGYDNISAGTWFVAVDLQMSLLFVVLMLLVRLLSGNARAGSATDALALTALFLPLGISALFGFSLNQRYDPWILYFFHMPLLGAMAWWAIERRIPRLLFVGYAALMAVAAAIRCWEYVHAPNSPALAKSVIAMAVAVATGAAIYVVGRRGHLGDRLAFGWLQYLGRISYSLFLVHYPVSWCVLYFGCHWTGDHAASAILWLLVAFTTSILAAHWFHRFVEAPSLQLCTKLKRA